MGVRKGAEIRPPRTDLMWVFSYRGETEGHEWGSAESLVPYIVTILIIRAVTTPCTTRRTNSESPIFFRSRRESWFPSLLQRLKSAAQEQDQRHLQTQSTVTFHTREGSKNTQRRPVSDNMSFAVGDGSTSAADDFFRRTITENAV